MPRMEWRVYLAHPLEDLADRWVEDWQEVLRRPDVDVFRPLRVLVPNRNLKRWLQMHISRRGFVAANLRFQYLEEGIRSLLQELDPSKRTFLLNRTEMQSRILLLLTADLDRNPGVSFEKGGRRYPLLVSGEVGKGNDSGQKIRLFQLSARLAALFEDYTLHRPRSMEQWRGVTGPSLDLLADSVFDSKTEAEPICREQRDLYAQVLSDFDCQDIVNEPSEEASLKREARIPAAEYARRLLARNNRESEGVRPPVSLFGLSLLSRMHVNVLAGLSSHCDLRFYLPDLCPTLFESTGEGEWASVRLRENKDRVDGREGASTWSEPVADLFRLLHEAVPDGVWLQRVGHPRKSDLSNLHNRMRGLDSDASREEGGNVIRGLQILSCPGEWREIETAYQMILASMKENPSLRLTDIALLVTDMEHYRPFILHVFERETGPDGNLLVPYNLSDYSADGESRFAAGVRALLELVEGPLTRSRVFALFYNPCFLARRGIDRETIREWLTLIDDVRVHRDFDASERREEQGGADAEDGRVHDRENARENDRGENAFTWLRGLRRLYLGMLSGDRPVAGMDPHPLLVVDRDGIFQLTGILEEIHTHRTRLRSANALTGKDRLEAMLAFIDAFLQPPSRLREEEKIAEAFHQSIHAFDVELFRERVYLHEAIRSSLAGIDGGRGHYLAGGVTICSLQPMRPVPFRHIFIAGLGEGRFPGREDRSSLDLLYRDRRHGGRQSRRGLPTGDSGLPEKARVLFLETLLSAGERLVLLYNGRDTSRDRDLLPSSPVLELLSFCPEQDGIHRVPLKLYSRRYLAASSDTTKGEMDDILEPTANLSNFDLTLAYRAVVARMGELHHGSVVEGRPGSPPAILSVPERTSQFQVGEGMPNEVSIRELVDFLRHPVEAVLKRRLGIRDSDLRDATLEDDESFHLEGWDAREFQTGVHEETLRRVMENPGASPRTTLEEVLNDLTAVFARKDRMPPPPYDRIQRHRWLMESDLFVLENASSLIRESKYHIPRLRFSAGADAATPALEIAVDIGSAPVRLTGELRFLCTDAPTVQESQSVGALLLSQDRPSEEKLLALVPGLMALSCAKANLRDATILVARNGDPRSTNSRTVKTQKIPIDLTVVDVRTFFHDLISDYLSCDLEYLPLEMLRSAGLWKDLLDADDEVVFSRLRESAGDRPDRMDLLQLIDPRITPDAVTKVRRRWGPLVKLIKDAQRRRS